VTATDVHDMMNPHFSFLARASRSAGALTLFTALLAGLCTAASAHVVLDEPAALAGTSYRAAFRIGHGCAGSATTAVKVFIPAGFSGAKPMPKPGWSLAVRVARLDKPYTSHGREVTEDVAEISWTARSRDDALPDAWYDEFVLRGSLSAKPGPMWFRVLQTCESGSLDWAEIPASGTSTRGLKSPAALLEVIESGHAGGHQH
jgi:uncharacterized protein YcnI